ncbi:MAG: 1-acyl-sn-glycerol-3-phosphate acyltransferase [Saprospiraceae bacterium]|nr:1-acyl-sn-glycerol-3-phosphate acyltransferase [Saprospiraceae bacterium]
MLGYILAIVRLLVFMFTMVLGMSYIVLASLVAGKNLRRSMKIRRRWIKFITPVLGLDIQVNRAPDQGVYLYISNHRSFIDPVVILNFIYALPLAKAEVNSYPVIGFGARLTGILYVVRDSADSRLDARQSIANTLLENWSVLVYPEGTTEITPVSGVFKKGSFEIASVLNIPVVPVAIEFKDPKDHWKELSLFRQYLYQFGKIRSTCRIEFGDPINSEDPADLLNTAKTWIDDRLLKFRQEFDQEI